MKVVLGGAFGHLGTDVLKHLLDASHEVVAADMVSRPLEGYDGRFSFRKIDATKPETMAGLCDGAEVVISTIGLTGTSATVTNYDIDLNGNRNLLNEAKKAGVRHFVYISVIRADEAPDVPMLDAKAVFERELKESGLTYVIHRPTGYFYDIAKVFMPMIEKGKVTLLGKENYKCNVVDTTDFADFIVRHMLDENAVYEVGGKETYTYEEIANMFAEASGKQIQISRAPTMIFDILAKVNKWKKNGKEAIIKFSKFTLTHDLVGKDVAGDLSFREYIQNIYK